MMAKDHNARQRMTWLLHAFGLLGDPPGPPTQEEMDALVVLSGRILRAIPLTDELSEAQRAALPIYGALLEDYDFEITAVVRA